MKGDGRGADTVDAAAMPAGNDKTYNAGLASSLVHDRTVKTEDLIKDGKTCS